MKTHHFRLGLCIGLLCLTQVATATTYYVSNSARGNDNSANPSSSTTPWKTIDRVNRAALNSNDRVLFFKGDRWEETLKPISGVTYTSHDPSATGGLPAPLITGSNKVSGARWLRTAENPNIWVADVADLVKPEEDASGQPWEAGVEQLIVNGQRMPRARYPNIGNGEFGMGKNRFLRLTKGGSTVDLEHFTDVIDLAALRAHTQRSTASLAELVDQALLFTKNADYRLTPYKVRVTTIDELTRDQSWGLAPAPIQAGNGYWLENKRWMLDQPGEWVYEAATKKLYFWPPASTPDPSANIDLRASVRVHAVLAKGVPVVKLDGLAFEDTRGTAVSIFNRSIRSEQIKLTNLSINRAGRSGIAVLHATAGTHSIENSWVGNSVTGGIDLVSDSTANFRVANNSVVNTGIGYYAFAAIWMGHGSEAVGNYIDGASYLGIHVAKFSNIHDNTIVRTCLEFNDCGAIYTRGQDYDGRRWDANPANPTTFYDDVFTTINHNFVSNASAGVISQADRSDGVSNIGSHIKGIYLDDRSAKVTVSDNYVEKFDYGVMLHFGRYNKILNNKIFGNARNQIWLQEDTLGLGMCTNPATVYSDTVTIPSRTLPFCDASNYMVGNEITGNAMASVTPDANANVSDQKIIRLTTDRALPQASTSDFATFSGNKYADFKAAYLVYDETPARPQPARPHADWLSNGRDTGGWWIPSVDYPPVGRYNALALSASGGCPIGDAAYCSSNVQLARYLDLSTGKPVAFPLAQAASSSVILSQHPQGLLSSGQLLVPGQAVLSPNGRYRFIYQTDGNLVLYDGSKAKWHSATYGRPGDRCVMQTDGNLVIYATNGQSIWRSNTSQYSGSVLKVQNNGDVVIFNAGGTAVWRTNTAQP